MSCFRSTIYFVSLLLACLTSYSEACKNSAESNYTAPAEYSAQSSQCNAFTSTIPAPIPVNHPDVTAINAVIGKGVEVSGVMSGSEIDWRAFILEGWSGGSGTILVAPVVLILILAFMILSFLPCCIARCCCPSNCCVPKHLFGEFPKKGCCGKCMTTFVWLIFILGLLACFLIAWLGFATFFNGFTETSCQSMSVLNSTYEFVNDIFTKFLGILDAFDLNSLILGPATVVLQRINGSAISLRNTANATIEKAVANCLNISDTPYSTNFTIDCNERIPSIDAAIVDTSSLDDAIDQIVSSLSDINETLQSAKSSILTVQNSALAPFDSVASSLFGFSFSGSENDTGSVLPAVPEIPVLFPNGLESGASINTLLLSVTEEQWRPVVVGVAAFLPMLLFVVLIMLGTCCMCCGNNTKQISKITDQKRGKKNCCVCCGLCWNRFGCGALYFCNVIFIIVTIVLVFVNTFYSYSCGVITLPPSELTGLVLNNPTLNGALPIDNSTRTILSAISGSLESDGNVDLAPLLSSFGLNASSLEINVTQYEDSLQDELNTSSVINAVDNGRNSLITFRGDFTTLNTNKSDMQDRQNACFLSCNSMTSSGVNVWEAALLSYNRTDLFQGAIDAMDFCVDNYNTICGSSTSPFVESWEACNVTFCEMNTVSVKLDVLVKDATQGLDLIDVDLLDIRGSVSAIPDLISDIFDTIEKQNISECLDIDISPVTGLLKQLTEPICSRVYTGYSMISWSSFAFCVISALLFIVQALMNVRYGGVGQKGLLKVSQELGDQGDDDDMHNLGDERGGPVHRASEVENPLYVNPILRPEKQAWADERKPETQNDSRDIEMTNVSAFQESEIEV